MADALSVAHLIKRARRRLHRPCLLNGKPFSGGLLGCAISLALRMRLFQASAVSHCQSAGAALIITWLGRANTAI
jgi:hypothetical protein